MYNSKKIGNNICALRKAYGETQEELGAVLNVEKSTISSYENGNRNPNNDMLTEIAKHFMISVEELMNCDLSDIGKITVDKNVFWRDIDKILPIIESYEALKNEHFKKAYKYHRNIYDELRKGIAESIDHIVVCFDEYLEAYEDEEIKPETAANFWAIYILLLLLIKTAPLALKNRPAALLQIAAKDSKVKQILDNDNSNLEKDFNEVVASLYDDEMTKLLVEMRTTVKRSSKWSELADYYLALQYVWNIVDNEMGWDFNRKVGEEMLNAYISVGNEYAAYFLKCSLDSMGQSLQNVDDR